MIIIPCQYGYVLNCSKYSNSPPLPSPPLSPPLPSPPLPSQIAEDLNDEASPEIISRVTGYFLEHGQFEKAVELLVKSKRLGEALDLCVANSVTITEELAERMSIPKRPKGMQTGCGLSSLALHHHCHRPAICSYYHYTVSSLEAPAETERRVQMLERLAECCAGQGSYHLATKKYTQAGNKTKVGL